MNLQAYIVEVSETVIEIKISCSSEKGRKEIIQEKGTSQDTMKEYQSIISVYNVAIGLLLVSNMEKS